MVDPKVTREKTVRKAKTNLILDAALKVFSEQGFHETRLEDIATAAGFSKASLYNYYKDKEEIFLSLAIREYNKLNEILHEVIESEGTFISKIRKILGAIFKLFGEHFAILLTISNFRAENILALERLHTKGGSQANIFKNLHDEISQLFTSLFQTGKSKGEITTTIKDAVLAQYFGALIRGVLMEWKIEGKIGDTQNEIDQMVIFIRNGMGCTS